jgi:hypothetical protein
MKKRLQHAKKKRLKIVRSGSRVGPVGSSTFQGWNEFSFRVQRLINEPTFHAAADFNRAGKLEQNAAKRVGNLVRWVTALGVGKKFTESSGFDVVLKGVPRRMNEVWSSSS